MCRNIKPLFNYDPPATKDDVRNAALQFVRKISGFQQPSQANAAAFDQAVNDIARVSTKLLGALVTKASPHDRAGEEATAHKQALRRFGR